MRHFFLSTYAVDPPIATLLQINCHLLHKLECSQTKTLNFSGADCHIKERYMDSRERVSAFTFLSSDGKNFNPELLFKGVGKLVKLRKMLLRRQYLDILPPRYYRDAVLTITRRLKEILIKS